MLKNLMQYLVWFFFFFCKIMSWENKNSLLSLTLVSQSFCQFPGYNDDKYCYPIILRNFLSLFQRTLFFRELYLIKKISSYTNQRKILSNKILEYLMTISHFSLIFGEGMSRLSLHDGILGTWKKERNVGLKKLQNLY